MKFFWNNTSGLNADIERHRAEEKEPLAKIADLEQKQDQMSIDNLIVYRRLLAQLQKNKSGLLNKLGRKK